MASVTSVTSEAAPLVLCCQCGITIPANPANMCVNCIRNEVDITEGIPKQITVNFCKNCDRWLQPPNSWIVAQLESKELLALLLRKLKGLNKVRLIDASFIWTEPHSRRLKLKLTIQKQVFASTILQQVFQIEAVMASMMCNDCNRLMAQNTWNTVVQVRQKGVLHKKTFLFLEQLILKHQAHKDTINIKECREGLDFFFGQRNHALHFVSFLQSVVPIRQQHSQQIISSDLRSNTANFKYTYSVEIVPICKDDLVVLPLKLAKQLGNIHPLVLCTRVSGSGLTVFDVRTVQHHEVQTSVFWRAPFASLCEAGVGGVGGGLTDYYVIDVEPVQAHGKYMLADVTVARCYKNDQSAMAADEDGYEVDYSTTFITRSHLGHILHPGDYAQGYNLHSTNFNSDLYEELVSAIRSRSSMAEIPDVILVKKFYPQRMQNAGRRQRHWKLKRLADQNEGMMDMDEDVKRQQTKRGEQERRAQEWEGFMRELEEDKELRGIINLYRDPTVAQPAERLDEDDVDLAELLEEMEIVDSPPDVEGDVEMQ